MSALSIAVVAAVITTVLAAGIPADRIGDRQARSWVPTAWRWYRLKLLGLQLGATLVLSLGAAQIGWKPADNASGFEAAAHGVGWAVTAVALLRADFPGLRAGETAPGFSLLRAVSDHLTNRLQDQVGDAVRTALPADLGDLKARAFTCKARAFPARTDGSQSPDGKAYIAAIELLAAQPADDDLRELVVDTVLRHQLPRCW